MNTLSLEFFAELKQKMGTSLKLENTYFTNACKSRRNIIIGGAVENRDLMYSKYLDSIIVSLSTEFEILWSWKYGGNLRDVITKVVM